MNANYGWKLLSLSFDFLETFNYVKYCVGSVYKYMANYYGLSLFEMEFLIDTVHFKREMISSNIGNEGFFIPDDDYETIEEVFLSLTEKGFFEIDSKNITDDSYYYTYQITDFAFELYADLLFLFNVMLDNIDRDDELLENSYDIANENIKYLLGDLQIVSTKDFLEVTLASIDKIREGGELNHVFKEKIDQLKEKRDV